MAAWAEWVFVGGFLLIGGIAILVDKVRNPVYPDDPFITDEVDAFFAAVAVVWVIVGTLGLAAAIPGIDTTARSLFGVVLGGSIAIGLLWGSSAALRRCRRLASGTAKALDYDGESDWSLQDLVGRLVTVVLGFRSGAAVISGISLGFAIFVFTQLAALWDRDYAQVDRAFEWLDSLDGVVGRLAFVVGMAWAARGGLLRLMRAGPTGYGVALVLLGIWGVVGFWWVGWVDVSTVLR